MAGAVTWLLVSVVALGWFVVHNSSQQLEPEVDVWAPVQAAAERTSTTVGLAFDWAASEAVYAPQWSGIVQETDCRPDSTLKTGATLARVDNVQRIAFHSATPFVRELADGDEGDDVSQLHGLLESLGIDNPGGNRFTYWTGVAVGELAQRIGLSNKVRAFDPSWLLYLPAPRVDVAECMLVVGRPAPATGEVVVRSSPRVTRAVVVTPALVETLLATPPAGEAEEARTDVAAATAVGEGDRIVVQAGDVLSVANNAVEVDITTSEVLGESLALVDTLLQPLTPASAAVLSSLAPAGSWVVPTEAVFAGITGGTCVLARDGDSETPVPVEIVGYDAAGSLVLGNLKAETKVLIAPRPGQRSCA